MLTACAFTPDYLSLRAARILLRSGGVIVVEGALQSKDKPEFLRPEAFNFLLVGYEFSATGQLLNAAKIHHLLEIVYPDVPVILWSHSSWDQLGTTCRWRQFTVRLDALASPAQLIKTVDALMHQVSSSKRQRKFRGPPVNHNTDAKSERGVFQTENDTLQEKRSLTIA